MDTSVALRRNPRQVASSRSHGRSEQSSQLGLFEEQAEQIEKGGAALLRKMQTELRRQHLVEPVD